PGPARGEAVVHGVGGDVAVVGAGGDTRSGRGDLDDRAAAARRGRGARGGRGRGRGGRGRRGRRSATGDHAQHVRAIVGVLVGDPAAARVEVAADVARVRYRVGLAEEDVREVGGGRRVRVDVHRRVIAARPLDAQEL